MYSIGKFSKITGVTTKTLIWYDKVGLLKPEKVDVENGYRYYNDNSLKRLANIHFWQAMGFSVKEIANLNKDLIANKIETLQNKIDFIASNIDFLKNIKENVMQKEKLSIFEEMDEKTLQGKWDYKKSSTDFNDVIDEYLPGEKDEMMPQHLFFGQRNLGTDLRDTFGYTNCFTLYDNKDKQHGFWYFVVNYKQTLVLYEKPKDENSKVMFHIYNRENDAEYTTKEIHALCEKYSPVFGAKDFEFNQNFIGNWKIFDKITESKINTYDGKQKCEEPECSMSPLFDCLKIDKNQEVIVMEEGEEIEFNFSNWKRVLNAKNSKITIKMSKTSDCEFVIINTLTKSDQHYKGQYLKIGEEEFLFVNLDNDPDLDESIYVYKKEN